MRGLRLSGTFVCSSEQGGAFMGLWHHGCRVLVPEQRMPLPGVRACSFHGGPGQGLPLLTSMCWILLGQPGLQREAGGLGSE